MAAITCQFNAITGRFKSVNRNRRTEEASHDWAHEAAAVIADEPANVTEWLKLADRLEEEGNPAAILIRALFQDGYEMPAGVTGSIYRGGRYVESGERYSEGVSLHFVDGDGWRWAYVGSGSGAQSGVTAAAARDILCAAGGANCEKWYEIVIEAWRPVEGRSVPAGTKVMCWKGAATRAGGSVAGAMVTGGRVHTTNEAIPVPADAATVRVLKDSEMQQMGAHTGVLFERDGWSVWCPVNAVATW